MSIILNVANVLKSYGYELKDVNNKTLYMTVTGDKIPFDCISKTYKSSSKIDICKMVHNMHTRNTIKTLHGSKSYGLIDMYHAIEKVSIDDSYNLIENDIIFSPKDKFIYKTVKLLNTIFLNIEKDITTNYIISSVDLYCFDLIIKLSDEYQIIVEYHDPTYKEPYVANMVASYLKYRPTDNFDNFFKGLCLTIIRFKNIIQKNDNINLISRLLAYGLNVKYNLKKDYVYIREILQIFKKKSIHIKNLAEFLGDEVKNVVRFIHENIDNKIIDNKNIMYNRGDIFSISQPEINKIISMYSTTTTNDYRIIYDYVIEEYINILNGEYDIYQYRCSDQLYTEKIEGKIEEKINKHRYEDDAGSDF